MVPGLDGAVVAERSSRRVLDVDELTVEFTAGRKVGRAVDRVSFGVDAGEVLGIVGESGSGKSMTAMAILGLIHPPGRVASGSIQFQGRDLRLLSAQELRKIRGRDVAMIFQDPMSSMNPVITVGSQIVEAIRLHRPNISTAAARTRAIELLDLVRVPDAARRARQYPHELSGGLRQRSMIAMAIANEPALLIADEPTTALDVTIQAQILDLLQEIQLRSNRAMIIITHDLGVLAEYAHRVLVMYAGRIVERGEVDRVLAAPTHPYTAGLLKCVMRSDRSVRDLNPIPGAPPSIFRKPSGCAFHPRCALCRELCTTEEPALTAQHGGSHSACHFAAELQG